MLTLILVICIVGYILIELFGATWKDIWFNTQIACVFVGVVAAFFDFFMLIAYLDTRHIDEEIKLYEDALQESVETYGVDSYYYKINYHKLMQLKQDKIHTRDYKWLLYFGK
jgi:hypothetical protein